MSFEISKSDLIKINEIGEWLGAGSLNYFGRQFAGKDTQAGKFGNIFGVPVLGGGNIIRACIEAGTISPEVRDMMNNGELIPSDDYERMVLPVLGSELHQGRPLLLSSVGRMFGEESGVLAVTVASGHPIMAVPYIDITEAEAFKRMACSPSRGRDDDTQEGLKKRLQEFYEQTIPVLNVYESLDLLVEVNGMQEEDVVFNNLVGMLHERSRAA